MFIDAEHAVDERILVSMGLMSYLGKSFFLVREATFARVSDILDKTIASDLSVLVIDSITALRPSKLDEMNVEDVEPGLQARLQSVFFNKFKQAFARAGTVMIFPNQMRVKINFRRPSTEEPSGGNALKFYTDVRLSIKKKQFLERGEKDNKENYGADCFIEIIKNKVTGNVAKIPMTIIYGQGVSNVSFIVWRLIQAEYITQRQSYFIIKTPQMDETVRGREQLYGRIKEEYVHLSSLVLGEGGSVSEESEEEGNEIETKETKEEKKGFSI